MVLTASCSAGSGSAVTYEQDLSTAVETTATAIQNPIDWVGSGTTGRSKALDMAILLEQRPPQPPESLREIIQRAERVHRAAVAIDAVVRAADRDALAIPREAQSSVDTSDSTDSPKSRAAVTTVSQELLHDVVCSLANDRLSAGEKAQFATRRAIFSLFSPITPEALSAEIRRRTATDVLPDFAVRFPWDAHAGTLMEAARRQARNFEGQIEGPDLAITKAYVYGIRNCLERVSPTSVAV
jgi:hypothetical protein